MKAILLALLLASAAGLRGEEISRYYLDRMLEVSLERPVRWVDGEFVDLSGVFRYFRDPKVKANPLPQWRPILGRAIQVLDGGLVVQCFERSYEAAGKTVFITNYVGEKSVVDGDLIAALAFQHGRQQYRDRAGAKRTVEMWDCGGLVPGKMAAEVIAAKRDLQAEEAEARAKKLAELAAAKKLANEKFAVQQLQTSAEGGSHHSQYALGMRYLAGRGVETNRDLAIEWLRKAARNGSESASNELNKIDGRVAR